MAAPTARPKRRGTPQVRPKKRNAATAPSMCRGELETWGENLLSSTAVSAIVGIPVKTLSDWRYRNQHLPYYRLGNHVRYDAADIAAFLALHREEIDPDGVLTVGEVAALGRHLEKVRELLAAHRELSTFIVVQRGGLVGKWS